MRTLRAKAASILTVFILSFNTLPLHAPPAYARPPAATQADRPSAGLLPAWFAGPTKEPAAARSYLPNWFSPDRSALRGPVYAPPARRLYTGIPLSLLTVNVDGPAVASLGAPVGSGEVYTAVIRNSSTMTAYSVYLTAAIQPFFVHDGGDQLVSSAGPLPFSVVAGPTDITWTPNVTFDLAFGDAITLNFKLRATCGAQSGQQMRVGVRYNADPPPAPPDELNDAGLNITTGRGNLVIKKEPAIQNLGTPDFGQPITWTVTVQNTGLGKLYDAVITDTGGISLSQPGGDLTPSVVIPVLDVNETRTFTVVGAVEACNFTNVAQAAWPCGNLEGDAAFTNPISSTVSVLFTPDVPRVSVQAASPITFPYCAAVTRTVALTVNNTGGPAGSFRMDSSFESDGYLQVILASVPADWLYTPADGVFAYHTGSPTGTLPPFSTLVLTFQVRPAADYLCAVGGGSIVFDPSYNDVCTNNPFLGNPVSLDYQAAETAPTLNVAKTGPAIVASGEVFTYQVTVWGDNPANISGAVLVTDALPATFEMLNVVSVSAGSVATTSGGLSWNFDPPAAPTTYSETLVYRAQATITETQCGAADVVANDVQAAAVPTCPGCAMLAASDGVDTAIENNEGVFTGVSTSGSLQACSSGFTIANSYLVTGSTVVTWTGAVFTEALGTNLGSGYLTSSVPLIYQPGSLIVAIGGTDYTPNVTATVTPGGQLVVDLNGLQAAAAPTQNFTLYITYTVAISEASLEGAVSRTFYDWSRLYLPNFSDVQGCAANNAFNQVIILTISRGDLSLALSPPILDKCGANPVVIAVNDNQLGDLTDHIVITFTASSAQIASARNFSFVGSLAAVSPITITADADIGGGMGVITFTLPPAADIDGDGEIHFDVDLDCNDESPWQARVTFLTQCALPHADETSLSHAYREAGLILFATPIQYSVREKDVLWKFFLTNNGNLTATNVLVTNTIAGLSVYTYTASDPTGISLLTPLPITGSPTADVAFNVASLAPGEQRAITLTARVAACNPLYVDILAQRACFGQICQRPTAHVSFNTPPPYLLTNNGETADLPMCDPGQVIFTTKNASPDVTLYQLDITETLRGLTPIPGAPITVTIENPSGGIVASTTNFNPITQTPAPAELLMIWQAALAPTEVATWFQALPPLYIVRVQIPVQTHCIPPATPQSFAAASALGPCGAKLGYAENAVTLQTLQPDMTVLKEGKVAGGNYGDIVFAAPGQTVTWRIQVDNRNTDRAYVAHNVILSDTWPPNFDFITATTGFSPTLLLAARTITWNIGDVAPAAAPLFFYITGTVVLTDDACGAATVNAARLSFGCDFDGCTSDLVPQDTANLGTQPDPAVTVNPGPLQTCAGDIPILISNDGAAAYSATLTVTLPGGYVYSHTISSGLTPTAILTDPTSPRFLWDVIPGRTTANPYQFTLLLRVRNSAASGTCPVDDGRPVTATLAFDNHPACAAPVASPVQDSVNLQVLSPDLSVAKTPPTQIADVGQRITWTLTVLNTGDGLAENVIVADVVGSNYDAASILAGNGSDGAVPTVAGHAVTWTLSAPIAASGGAWTAQLSAVLLSTGDNRNTVTAAAYCATGCATTVAADTAYATLAQDFGKFPLVQTDTVGALLVFTFTASLPDQNALYEQLTLTDALPLGLGYVSSAITVTYDGDSGGPTIHPTPTFTPGYQASGAVVWALGDLSGTVQIDGLLSAILQDAPSNQAGVRLLNDLRMTYTDDGQPYVFTDTAGVDIVEPQLTLVKASDPPTSSTVGAGDFVTYTLVITNQSGPAIIPAYRLYVTDTLPAHVTLLSPLPISITLDGAPLVSPTDFISTYTGSQLTFDFSDGLSLPVGGQLVLVYRGQVDPDAPGGEDQVNTLQVGWSAYTSTVPGERVYLQSDGTTIHAGYPALPLDKSAAPPIVDIGERITYTLRVTNTGLVSATGVLVTDAIPAYTTFVAATDPHIGPAGGVITWPLGTLDIGEFHVLTLVVQVLGPAPAGTLIDNAAWVTCAEGISRTDAAATPLFAELGNYVWIDTDADGVQNDGNTGLNGVAVTLYTDDGDGLPEPGGDDAPLSATLTADDAFGAPGYYTFTRLIPGDYFVVFTPPPTYVVTFQDQGGDDALDSDANPATGVAIVTTLESAERDPTWDAGLYLPAGIGDRVWYDNDADGLQDAGEPGVPAVSVTLYTAVDAPVSSTVTSITGFYQFTNLLPSDYYLIFTPTAEYTITPPDQGGDDALDSDVNPITRRTILTDLESGEYDPTWDAGLYRMDLGDAPDANYATLLTSDGARHILLPAANPTLGATVDAETDGQPSAGADGDDTAGAPDDEDGVTWLTALAPGEAATLTVAASAADGWLNAWIDLNGDGDWSELSDQIAADVFIAAGTSVTLAFTVPSTATQGLTYARFRFSSQTGLTPTGRAPDGEIEDYLVSTLPLDYGDLPDAYGTLFGSSGPHHVITGTNPTLGATVDAELDGQPSAGADGDDLDGLPDDEDGVRLDSPLLPGALATMTITGTNVAGAVLNAWLDFNGDMDFADAGEQLFTDQSLLAGPNVLTFNVPLIVLSDTLNARFRYGAQPGLTPHGFAPDGEIEDHQYAPAPMDLGDLPQGPYPTTVLADGARHALLPINNPTLGATVDAETDGQPSANADGDDLNGLPDDEDGVRLDSQLIPGAVATMTITATNAAGAALNAWLDFDGDGVLTGPGEHIFTDRALLAGPNLLTFSVPLVVLSDTLNGRFRYGTQSGLTPTGPAFDGEIEDHQFTPTPMDLGDLPDSPYPTTLASDGPRHAILPANNPTLGATVDAESDGQPSANADGDDLNGLPDDEDGVRLDSRLVAGEVATLTVTGTNVAGAVLNAWLDFDGDGVLTGPGEQIAADRALLTGPNLLTFSVPLVVLSDTINARFRYGTQPGLTPTGPAPDGEIEDHPFAPTPVEFGDLPDGPYPTTLASDGARHVVDGVTFLGASVDAEADGQPSLNADGDDLNDGSDDEDGVTFLTPLMRAQAAQIRVVAASDGYLNGWIDFDDDGTLDGVDVTALDGAPLVTTMNDVFLAAGVHTFTIAVPDLPIGSSVYSRFRWTSFDTGGTLSETGLAADGEVEDYVLLSLGNRVWLDMGAGGGGVDDGAQNGTEAGIAGVTLELYRSGQLLATTTTDLNGDYGFTGLTPGLYVVHVPAGAFGVGRPLEGLVSSTGNGPSDADLDQDVDENGIDDAAPPVNGITADAVTLALGTEPTAEDGDANSNLTVDFGFIVAAGIGDDVWLDTDADGTQNEAGTGVAGVTVTLHTAAGVPVSTTHTDSAGLYQFTNLPPTSYYLVFNPPPDYIVTLPDQGGDDALDSDADRATGQTISTTLTPGEYDPTWDAGLYLRPGLLLSKTVSVGRAAPNMPITFSVYVSNTGLITFDPLQLTDTLPSPDFHYVAGSGVPAPDSIAGTTLVWNNVGPLAPGADLTLTFAVTVTPGVTGAFVNVALGAGVTPVEVVTDTDDAAVVLEDPSVAVAKNIAPPGVVNGVITFSIRITNTGPSVIDVLPLIDTYAGDITYVGGAPVADSVDDSAGLLVWNDLTTFLGNMAPGQTFLVETVFALTTDQPTFTATNRAVVTDAIDLFDNPANEDEDEVIIINQPTAVELLYLRATGQQNSVRVEWATLLELESYGFKLYRALLDQFGAAAQIAFLPSQGGMNGAQYAYVDKAVEAGQAYWYWLVEVDNNGQETRYGPVTATPGLLDGLWQRVFLPLVLKR